MDLKQTLNSFMNDLLHIEDVKRNKLLNVYASKPENTFIIEKKSAYSNFSGHVLSIIRERLGKPGTVALKNSSIIVEKEQITGPNACSFDWKNGVGERDASYLQRTFITGVYKDLSQKGTNPLYLTVGALEWQLDVGQNEIQTVVSPILIFPIRLVRPDATYSPVLVEFVNDDAYLNPCLTAKLKQIYGVNVTNNFPHPDKDNLDLSVPISFDVLGTGEEFFERLNEHFERCNAQDENDNGKAFKLDKDFVSIISYNHDEICMYYDIQRNKEKIHKSDLVAKIFGGKDFSSDVQKSAEPVEYILPKDSVQEDLIKRVVNGESLIIKGPPGTGKTLTITNMLASLLSKNKKVLLCSKKLAALNEIYKKLPESLRRFTMLLDCESESQTASLNPSEVRKDFISLLNDKKTYSQRKDLGSEITQTKNKLLENVTILREHKDLTFEKRNILGKSYYEALDFICDKQITPVNFIAPSLACSITQDVFNVAKNQIEKMQTAFEKITALTPFEKNPFLPLNTDISCVDTEKVIALNKEICEDVRSLFAEWEEFLSSLSVTDYENLDVTTLLQIADGTISAQWLESAFDKYDFKAPAFDFMAKALSEFKRVKVEKTSVVITGEKTFEEYGSKISSLSIDDNLRRDEFLSLNENLTILTSLATGLKLPLLNAQLDKYNQIIEEKEKEYDEFYSIFNKEKRSFEDKQFSLKAISCFQKYFDTKKEKPDLLDFGAKSLYKKLAILGYKKEITFVGVVNGLKHLKAIIDYDDEILEILDKISSILKTTVTEKQIHAVVLAEQKAKEQNISFKEYVDNLNACSFVVLKLLNSISASTPITLFDLKKAVEKFMAEKTLFSAVVLLEQYASVETAEQVAEKLISAKLLINDNLLGDKDNALAVVKAIATKAKEDDSFKIRLNSIKEKFLKFEKELFSSYYANVNKRLSLKDLKLFSSISCDRALLGASDDYLTGKNAEGYSWLKNFFTPFENGNTFNGYGMSTVFEYSFYSLAIKEFLNKIGTKRNGEGEKLVKAYNDYFELDKKLQALTTELVESRCMSKIDPEDKAFSFLNTSRATGETLRLLFKKNADAIIKLKKCFLLSPSTTSVLLTNKAFFDFDVVICDEASQLEPTALLPLLIRTNQIVLVGDEWQMPPIKRYSATSEKVIDEGDGEVTILSPNLSALSLALTNKVIKTAMLNCHYRSKTEALISFSQKSFYPFMHTFPAVEPKKDGVGLNDVFIEDGTCSGGENLQEAKAVINLIKGHFDRYYDKDKQILSASVGIVCFGEKQVALIQTLINKDRELSLLIDTAKKNFADEVKEKLFFIKSIDKVQGQEIEHLILSLTYGKDANGQIRNAFGELNRGDKTDKLGQCIFNVAVTRAKNSVTVVHSIHYTDITANSVSYIAEYLKQVDRFNINGKNQFVGDDVSKATGFKKAVIDFLTQNGISDSRIVLNYGVTDNSIKIPLVILDENESRALHGVWLETAPTKEYDYFDYNLTYFETLKTRGWDLTRIFIHDWVDNNETQKKQLLQLIKNLK